MAENDKVQVTAPAAKKDKAPKKVEKKKPGMFQRMGQWFKEMKAELKKVQWPTWKQTANNTLIVLAFCVVIGVCIWLFDLLATNLFSALVTFFHQL